MFAEVAFLHLHAGHQLEHALDPDVGGPDFGIAQVKAQQDQVRSSLPPSYQAATPLLHSLSSTARSLSRTSVPEMQANRSWPFDANCAIAGPPFASRLSVA